MKKKTAKILLIIGISLFIVAIILILYYSPSFSEIEGNTIGNHIYSLFLLSIFNPLSMIGFILIIISLLKWNSENKK